MKPTVYNCRADKLDLFRKYAEKYGAELALFAEGRQKHRPIV